MMDRRAVLAASLVSNIRHLVIESTIEDASPLMNCEAQSVFIARRAAFETTRKAYEYNAVCSPLNKDCCSGVSRFKSILTDSLKQGLNPAHSISDDSSKIGGGPLSEAPVP